MARPVVGAACRLAVLVALALAAVPARSQERPRVVPGDSLPSGLRQGGPGEPGRGDALYGGAGGVRMGVRVTPATARLGEALTYRGSVLVESPVKVRFEPPKSGGATT